MANVFGADVIQIEFGDAIMMRFDVSTSSCMVQCKPSEYGIGMEAAGTAPAATGVHVDDLELPLSFFMGPFRKP